MGKLLLIFHGDNIASFEKRSHFFIHLFLNCYSNSRKLLAVIYTYYIHIYIYICMYVYIYIYVCI